MPRLLFEKTGNAVFISHLDLMRLFQRAFKRAGLALTHTRGFNPRPSVSIALPLSVGVESRCELLDFDLDGEKVGNDEILTRLNDALVEGVNVLEVYDSGRKIKDISYLRCVVTLEYDGGVPGDAVEKIRVLFSRKSLEMEKRGKNGPVMQDIIPMIRELTAEKTDKNMITITALICCQNPALNPALISGAVARYLPECAPDFARCCRLEIYDGDLNVFR